MKVHDLVKPYEYKLPSELANNQEYYDNHNQNYVTFVEKVDNFNYRFKINGGWLILSPNEIKNRFSRLQRKDKLKLEKGQKIVRNNQVFEIIDFNDMEVQAYSLSDKKCCIFSRYISNIKIY